MSAEWLLQAAFLPGPVAVQAWEAWLSSVRLDDIDPESFGLLPLLHRNLTALGSQHPELGRLKGVRRRTWTENQLVLRDAAAMLSRLREARIDAILMEGLALVVAYYRDAGLRPVRRSEILVHREHREAAAALLALAPRTIVLLTPPLFLGCPQRIESSWWMSARPICVEEAPTRVLSPADQLFHTLLNGQRRSGAPQTWWMADALVILAQSVDIERVTHLAEELRVTRFLRRALERLDSALGVAVAPELAGELSRLRISRADELEFQYVTRARWHRPMLSWPVGPFRRYRRSRS